MLKTLTIVVLICSTVYGTFSPPTHIGAMIRDLYNVSKNAGDMMMMAKEWTVEGLISSQVKVRRCGLDLMLGGSGVIGPQGSFSRTYQGLVNHNLIYFDIGVKMIGNWKDQDTLTMKVDGSTLKTFTILKVGDGDKINICSDSGQDLDTRLMGHFYHSASSVTITLAWDLSSSSELSFGIADVSLILKSSNQNPTTNPANALLALTDTLAKGIPLSGSEDSGKTNCPPGHYNDGIYCKQCDASCQDCFGPSSSECHQCQWKFRFDGNKCVQCFEQGLGSDCGFCTSECLLCSPGFMLENGGCNMHETCKTVSSNKDLGDDRSSFFRVCARSCGSGSFMLWNSTCVNSCEPPLIQRNQDDHSWCDYPCSVNEYLTPDGKCLAACPSGYSSRMEGFFGFCDVIIRRCEDSSLYMFQNGSCLQNCSYPYLESFNDDGRFCNPPCPQGYFDPLNEVCSRGCEPDYIFFEDGILYCESENSTSVCPRPYDENRYSNGTCTRKACVYPFQQRFSGAGYFCDEPCPADYYFHSWEKRCVSECKSGNIRTDGIMTYCDPEPNCRLKTDYRYSDGTCKPDCIYPFNIRVNEEGYQFCEAPCPDGQYFQIISLQCVETCNRDFARVFGSDTCFYNPSDATCIKICASIPESTGCANPDDYRYPNGSCLASCEEPFSPRNYELPRFCDRMCGGISFLTEEGYCTQTEICQRKNVIVVGSLLICKADQDDGSGCPSYVNTKFSNGSCAEDYPPWPYLVSRKVGADYWTISGPCMNRYFIPTDTCSDTCPPLWIRLDGIIKWCDPNYKNGTCPSIDDYKYPNGSCLSNCPYPRNEEWDDGSYLCNPPCSDGEYFDILSDSCAEDCQPEFIRFEDDVLYCDGFRNDTIPPESDGRCPNIYHYRYPNGSCSASCVDPYKTQYVDQYRYCRDPCPEMYWDTVYGGCLDTCENVRNEGGIRYCDPEPPCDGFKYSNRSCLPTCPYPFTEDWDGEFRVCYRPCIDGGYYVSLNNTCVEDCDPEYIRYEDSILYCDTNSTTTCSEFKFANGSCLPTCPYPYRNEWRNGFYFCHRPCPGRFFDTIREVCVDDCEIQYMGFWEDNGLCFGPANNETNNTNSTSGCPNIYDFKYPNGSCLASCPNPRKDEWRDGSYHCDAPCSDGRYFDILSDSCVGNCEPENIRLEDDILYCDGSHNDTNSSEPDTRCSNSSHYKFANGSCSADCDYPFQPEYVNQYRYCRNPCIISEMYWYTLHGGCVDTCANDRIRIVDNIRYCDPEPGCLGYRYDNGSCLRHCFYPHIEQWDGGAYACHSPCADGEYFDILSDSCVAECEAEDIRLDEDILYCDRSGNGTNSSDPGGRCPNIYHYRYPNGSCSARCVHPYETRYIGQYRYCIDPCPNSYFDYSVGGCVDVCLSGKTRTENDVLICDSSSECTVDHAADGSATTDCAGPSGICPVSYFLFEDSSCSKICPKEFTPYLNASCIFPCGLNGALYPDGSCSADCSTGYTLEMLGNFKLCVASSTSPSTETYSMTVPMYFRYDIPLADFNTGGYLDKFIDLLAELLSIEPSEIKIISITEGSTIIKSEIELKSASDSSSVAATKNKASTMIKKLNTAADSKSLELDGIPVLNSRFGATTPDNDKVGVKKSSSSSSKILVVIVVIAAAAVAIALSMVAVYRNKVRKQSLQVLNVSKAKEEIAGVPQFEDDKKRDEEIGILDENSRFDDGSKSQTIPAHSDQDPARQRAKSLAQKRMQGKTPDEEEVVEKGKPISLNDIMNGVEA